MPNLELPSGIENIEEHVRVIQAKQTVTTASKREQSIQDVPLTISAIPTEELEGTGQFTLCDAIQYFPGLECRRGAMRKAAVSVRGLGSNFLSNRMLLLIDGMPATDPWTGQFYADETLPMTNLKQIEVIRGPGSSLYGSNAFSGVINMITRGPDDIIRDGRSWGVDARFLAGQYNTFRAQATAAGRLGIVKALINYYLYTTDGPHLLNDPSSGTVAMGQVGSGITDNNEWATTHQVSGKVEIKSVGIDAAYTWTEEGRPGGIALNAVGNCGRCHYTPRDFEHVEQFWANAHVDQKINQNFRIYAQAYTYFKRRDVALQNLVTGQLEDALGKRNRTGAEVRGLFTSRYVSVTVGGDAKFDTVNNRNILTSINPNDINEQIFGAFIDGEVRPLPKLILGAGARYDYYNIPSAVWENASSRISPRGSIVFHALPQITLRANYGRAFRAPGLVELAIDQQMYAATLLGNPYLKAETVDTYEGTVDAWPFREVLRLSATGFYNRATNLINQEQVGGSTSQFQNIGDAQTYGMNLEAAMQAVRLNLSVDVAYQLLGSRASVTSEGGAGPLDYAANHRFYFRFHKRFSTGLLSPFIDFYGIYVGARLDAAQNTDANGHRIGRIELPGYFVANARVGADIYRGLSASLIATNLFNAQYQEMLGFPAPGVSVFAELKYTH